MCPQMSRLSGGQCCAQNWIKSAQAFTSVSAPERPMLGSERDKIRLGVHKCLGSRKPMLCPERDKIRLGFHKCLGSKRPMLFSERPKKRSGFHKCLGSRRPMLLSESRALCVAWPGSCELQARMPRTQAESPTARLDHGNAHNGR